MNARTDLPSVAEVVVSPDRSALNRLTSRWRRRLMTGRSPIQVMLPVGAHAPGQSSAVTAATQAFEAWAARHEGAAVELLLSSHCLLMLADDGAGDASQATDAKALHARAVERWTHYLDLPAEGFDTDWSVQTSLDVGRSPVAVACAVPRALCEGLLDVARRHGVKLLAVQPWWASGLQQAWQGLPLPVAALVAAPDAVDVKQAAVAAPGQATRLWSWREGAWQTQARVSAESGRWVLRSLAFVAVDVDAEQGESTAVPDEVFDAPDFATVSSRLHKSSASPLSLILTRRASPAWAESLNFIGPRVRTSFWSWALLALGAIAIVHALELAGQVDEAQQAAQEELSRLQVHAPSHEQHEQHERHREQARAKALGSDAPLTGAALSANASSSASIAKPTSPEEHAPTLQPDAWRSAAQLAAWLGHPWAAALDHADATAHQRGISLTRFQLDLGAWGSRAEQPLAWRLQAAVPDDATALAWVQDLGPQAELQRRDALPQPVPSARGTLAWRIDVNVAGEQP